MDIREKKDKEQGKKDKSEWERTKEKERVGAEGEQRQRRSGSVLHRIHSWGKRRSCARRRNSRKFTMTGGVAQGVTNMKKAWFHSLGGSKRGDNEAAFR